MEIKTFIITTVLLYLFTTSQATGQTDYTTKQTRQMSAPFTSGKTRICDTTWTNDMDTCHCNNGYESCTFSCAYCCGNSYYGYGNPTNANECICHSSYNQQTSDVWSTSSPCYNGYITYLGECKCFAGYTGNSCNELLTNTWGIEGYGIPLAVSFTGAFVVLFIILLRRIRRGQPIPGRNCQRNIRTRQNIQTPTMFNNAGFVNTLDDSPIFPTAPPVYDEAMKLGIYTGPPVNSNELSTEISPPSYLESVSVNLSILESNVSVQTQSA